MKVNLWFSTLLLINESRTLILYEINFTPFCVCSPSWGWLCTCTRKWHHVGSVVQLLTDSLWLESRKGAGEAGQWLGELEYRSRKSAEPSAVEKAWKMQTNISEVGSGIRRVSSLCSALFESYKVCGFLLSASSMEHLACLRSVQARLCYLIFLFHGQLWWCSSNDLNYSSLMYGWCFTFKLMWENSVVYTWNNRHTSWPFI